MNRCMMWCASLFLWFPDQTCISTNFYSFWEANSAHTSCHTPINSEHNFWCDGRKYIFQPRNKRMSSVKWNFSQGYLCWIPTWELYQRWKRITPHVVTELQRNFCMSSKCFFLSVVLKVLRRVFACATVQCVLCDHNVYAFDSSKPEPLFSALILWI